MTLLKKTRRLIIVGDSAFAEVAFELFTHDSTYQVVAFAVERPFLRKDELFGLPVIATDELRSRYSSAEHEIFVAITYGQLNRLRERLLKWAKGEGYRPASYISSRANVWPNVRFGEHCFVFENNVIQPFVEIGENVVLWSGNHIGHHSKIGSHVFISSHVVLSGFVEVGNFSFLGVNSTVSNNVRVGEDNWIGPNALILKDTQKGELYRTPPSEVAAASTHRFFRL